MKPGCCLCGFPGEFQASPGNGLREAFCPACGAKKRTSDLAAAIINTFAKDKAVSLSAIIETLAPISIFEAQAAGPLNNLLSRLPNYTCSEYFEAVKETRGVSEDVRMENLERLSFPDSSFDLVITQDVFEHIASPDTAFREIDRVLKPGGCHIFTVPIHEGHRTTRRTMLDSGQLIELAPPVYHGDPLRKESGCLVHTDFGDDIVTYLAALSIPSEIHYYDRFYAPEDIPWLADEAVLENYQRAAASGNVSGLFLYNSAVITSWKSDVPTTPEHTPEFTGERYMPTLDWPEVAFEHWHRYLYASEFVSKQTVLDIACGDGYGSFLLADRAEKVMAVDTDDAVICTAAGRYARDNLTFLTGSCVDIPIVGQAVFDVIVSFETLEHISALEQKKFIMEVKRLLKPGGLFIVSTPNKLLYSDIPGYCNIHHVREYYVDEFESMLLTYFPQVRLMGQKVYPVSYIWNESEAGSNFKEYGLEYHDGKFSPGEGVKKLLYAIAFCTDGQLATNGSSILLDLSERMMNFIRNLEEYAGRLAEKLHGLESACSEQHEQVQVLARQIEIQQHTSTARIQAMQEQIDSQAAEIVRLSTLHDVERDT